MATISSAGIGSGLDVNGIITKLMQVESQPLTSLSKKEASYQAKLSAFGLMQGSLSALQTSIRTLQSTSTFTGKSATVADSSVLTASAVLTAQAGKYDVAVSTVAKNQIVRTDSSYDLTDTFNGGTLDIQIGSTAGVGGTTKTITIADGSKLTDIMDAINAEEAGVRASIVNDGTTNRLIFTSDTTGSAGNIRIMATQTGSDVAKKDISDFDYLGADNSTMKQIRPPDNAVFSVDGLEITRSSNTVTDAINGVTLNLVKENSTTTLTVAANTESVTTGINAFVKAYNEAITQLRSATAYDATNKKSSVLTGDSTARSIQSQMSSLLQTNVTGIGGGIGRLSDIGISVQKDGTLVVNSTKLSAALADPDKDVKSLFTQTTSGNEGIAVRFYTLLDGIIGTNGLIPSRTDGINTSIKNVQKQTDAMNLRLTSIEKRYRNQFTSLDTLLASMQQTSSYLTQQLSSLTSSSS